MTLIYGLLNQVELLLTGKIQFLQLVVHSISMLTTKIVIPKILLKTSDGWILIHIVLVNIKLLLLIIMQEKMF